MIIIPLPGPEEVTDHSLVGWFQEQVFEMMKQKDEKQVPRNIPNTAPQHIQKIMEEYMAENNGGNRSEMKFKVTRERPTLWVGKYFVPTVVNTVAKNVNPDKSRKWNANKPGKKDYKDDSADVLAYEVCFDNTKNEEKEMQVVFDVVLVSAVIEDPDNEKKGFQVDKHIAPIDEQLNKATDAVQKLIKEMKYMEDRETRMKLTTDSINWRIQYFSYFSVAFLIFVAYTQIVYLKKYFQKIKLI